MRDQALDTYLADINEVPLLTADQEIELAKRISGATCRRAST